MTGFRTRGAVLRLAGVALLALAWCAAHLLRQRILASIPDDPLSYGLAAFAFLAGSGGATLAVLGSHVFDRIAVSRRWRPR